MNQSRVEIGERSERMSMLMRYRKTGGFQQLLTLLETCSPNRRAQLMNAIQAEDPGWAALLKTKILTLEKVFTWDPLFISEVTVRVPPRLLATAIHGLGPDAFAKATHTMTHMQKREMQTLADELRPTAGEVETARMKIIATVRELERNQEIDLNRVDPSVSVRDIKVA